MQISPAVTGKQLGKGNNSKATWFRPGGPSANPAGRPKGSRSKLAENFVGDLYTKWQERGIQAIDDMIDRNPGDFVKVVAGILPQKLEITNKFQGMTEADVDAAILRATADLTLIAEAGISGDASGGSEAEGTDEAIPVSTICEAEAVP